MGVHVMLTFSIVVVAVRFAHNDKTRLACCSLDGTLSIFSLSAEPPALVALLRGHMGPVNSEWYKTEFVVCIARPFSDHDYS